MSKCLLRILLLASTALPLAGRISAEEPPPNIIVIIDYHSHEESWHNGLKIEDQKGYSTHLITQNSVRFIEENKDRPFFLLVAHEAVHLPFQTPADTVENRKPIPKGEQWKRERIRPKYKIMLEEGQDIHPQAKDLPGERLALLAAALDDDTVNADVPSAGKMEVRDGKAILETGDGKFQSLEIDGLPAWKADGIYLYWRAPELDRATDVRVHLLYHDEGFGAIQLRYDSTADKIFAGKQPGLWKPAGEVRCGNSGQWMVVAFDLPDAKFSKRCNGGDLRLQCQGALTVGGVFYAKKQ